MASLTEIANLALAMVGSERITSLETDTSPEAKLANEFMGQVRRACLVQHPWNFARGRASLPALTDTPAFDWAYQYQVPADCLRVLTILSDDPQEPWTREGDRILCDLAAPLRVRYIRDFTDAGHFAPLFVDLMAATLAERLAIPLSASQQSRAAIERIIADIRSRARSVDAAEGTPEPQYGEAGVFIEARY